MPHNFKRMRASKTLHSPKFNLMTRAFIPDSSMKSAGGAQAHIRAFESLPEKRHHQLTQACPRRQPTLTITFTHLLGASSKGAAAFETKAHAMSSSAVIDSQLRPPAPESSCVQKIGRKQAGSRAAAPRARFFAGFSAEPWVNWWKRPRQKWALLASKEDLEYFAGPLSPSAQLALNFIRALFFILRI